MLYVYLKILRCKIGNAKMNDNFYVILIICNSPLPLSGVLFTPVTAVFPNGMMDVHLQTTQCALNCRINNHLVIITGIIFSVPCRFL